MCVCVGVMCKCVCVCVWVCGCVWVCVCVCVCGWVCVCMCMGVSCGSVWVGVMCECVCVCTCCVHICVPAYITQTHVRMYVHTYLDDMYLNYVHILSHTKYIYCMSWVRITYDTYIRTYVIINVSFDEVCCLLCVNVVYMSCMYVRMSRFLSMFAVRKLEWNL